MKKALLFALITVAIVLLIGTAAGAFAADDLRDRVQYDVFTEKVFVGVVHDKPTEFEGRMYFTLWTKDGGVAVEIGPKEFVKRSKFKLEASQMVTVVGMPLVISNREMILAREIIGTGSVFVVRDRNGQPMWEMNRPVQMDPEVGETRIPIS
jgi:hypothetical protein